MSGGKHLVLDGGDVVEGLIRTTEKETHKHKHSHREDGDSHPQSEFTISIDNGELISQREHDCLQKVKERPVAQGLGDKFLMIFVLARKLDAERAATLLTNNLAYCKDHNLDRLLTEADLPSCLDMMENPFSFWDETCVDKQGRGIVYLFPGRFPKPGQMTTEDQIKMVVYMFQRNSRQPLSWHRAGVCYVESLEGFSMRHVDTKGQQEVQKIYENNFPMRIQSILVVDPPARWFLRLLLKLAKTFMKAKIVSRVQILQREEVAEYIDADQLITEFGGNRTWDRAKWQAAMKIETLP